MKKIFQCMKCVMLSAFLYILFCTAMSFHAHGKLSLDIYLGFLPFLVGMCVLSLAVYFDVIDINRKPKYEDWDDLFDWRKDSSLSHLGGNYFYGSNE